MLVDTPTAGPSLLALLHGLILLTVGCPYVLLLLRILAFRMAVRMGLLLHHVRTVEEDPILAAHCRKNTLGPHYLHIGRVVEHLHSSWPLSLESRSEAVFLHSGIAVSFKLHLQV